MSDVEPDLDASLLQARSGDQAALGVLWRRLSPAVHGFLRARGAADPDALTNEVFLGAFAALPEFVGDVAQFRGLLFTIAQRRLVDEFRRRSRRPAEVAWDVELDDLPGPSAEDTVMSGQDEAGARALLDDLPPDQREVLMLRIFGDLTVDQVAAALGKTPGAVKALQRRGLDNLRRRVHADRAPATDLPSRRTP